jgi:hypothetical protein
MSSAGSWWRRRGLVIVGPLLAASLISVTLVLVAHGRSGGNASPAPDPVVLEVGADQVHQSVFDARVGVALAAAEQGGGPQPGDAQYQAFFSSIRARVMQSLIIDAVIGQEARVRGVSASDSDVQKEITADTSIAGGADQLATQLAQAGGSPAQLRDETRSRLNEAQLEDLLARDRADSALAQIAGGQSFATVAAVYSDDDTSRPKGGDLGSLQLDQLKGGDSVFLATITALQPGQVTPAPVRDAAGYEILRVDAATPATRSVHRILIAAPQPYTEMERPDWFTQAVLLAVSQDCAANQVRVLLPNAGQPCSTATPSASATASPAPAGSGLTPRPVPAGSATATTTG